MNHLHKFDQNSRVWLRMSQLMGYSTVNETTTGGWSKYFVVEICLFHVWRAMYIFSCKTQTPHNVFTQAEQPQAWATKRKGTDVVSILFALDGLIARFCHSGSRLSSKRWTLQTNSDGRFQQRFEPPTYMVAASRFFINWIKLY